MPKLVSPQDLEKWLMSIPPAQLAKERRDVKADLSAMSNTPLDEHVVNELSHQLFNLTVKYNLDIDIIMSATHLPHEAILRLQSGNPFVTKEALESQPEEPDYEDYEVRGLLTRDEYYSQQYEYDLVEDIRRLLD